MMFYIKTITELVVSNYFYLVEETSQSQTQTFTGSIIATNIHWESFLQNTIIKNIVWSATLNCRPSAIACSRNHQNDCNTAAKPNQQTRSKFNWIQFVRVCRMQTNTKRIQTRSHRLEFRTPKRPASLAKKNLTEFRRPTRLPWQNLHLMFILHKASLQLQLQQKFDKYKKKGSLVRHEHKHRWRNIESNIKTHI